MVMKISRLCSRALLTACLVLPAAAMAQPAAQRIHSGAGAVDYSHAERLQVGQYVRYLIRETRGGMSQESEQTTSVAGFDTVGSERCVWIETEFKAPGGVPQYCRTLVSLAIVGADSGTGDFSKVIADYTRRVLLMDAPGKDIREMPVVGMTRADRDARPSPKGETNLEQKRDSLPPTEVVTVAGKFQCVPVRTTRDFRAELGPKTGTRRLHTQQEEKIAYLSDAVPVTRIARQTHTLRGFDALLPEGAPADYQPVGSTTTSSLEIVLIKEGLDAKTAFPANAKIVPFQEPHDLPGGERKR
jgi:hypothetical protein